MKVFTVLCTVIFATFVVAGPIRANSQDENSVEKREVCHGPDVRNDRRLQANTDGM